MLNEPLYTTERTHIPHDDSQPETIQPSKQFLNIESATFDDLYTTSGDIIIGEDHLRMEYNPEAQRQLEKHLSELRAGDFIVIEHQTMVNGWGRQSIYPTFMQTAENFPRQENGITLVILDGDLVKTIIQQDSIADQFEKLGISKESYYFARGVISGIKAFLMGGLETEIQEVENNTKGKNKNLGAYLEGLRKIRQISEEDDAEKFKQKLEAIGKLVKARTAIDSKIRDIDYQDKLRNLKREHPDSTLFIVVGKNHMQEIKRALEDPTYITEIDPKDIEEFKYYLEILRS